MGFVQFEIKGPVAILTVDRPQALNALNKEVILSLHSAVEKLDKDPAVRAVILTGAGEKAFVAGADIAEFAGYSPTEGQTMSEEGQRLLFDRIETASKPFIAAINGFALGGGLELAMCCHIRIASENARMGLPEVSLGVIPGYGGTQRLPRLIGLGRAIQVMTTAKMISAQQAEAWGLVNAVVASEALMETTQALAQQIANNSPNAIAHVLRATLAGIQDSSSGFHAEQVAFGACFQSKEMVEGTTAFFEKRKPTF